MMRLTEQETEFLDKVFPLFRQLPEQKQQEVKTAMEWYLAGKKKAGMAEVENKAAS